MSESSPPTSGESTHFDWSPLYKTPDGKDLVDARQAAYWCVATGVEPPDYDLEVINALEYAGVPETASFVDIGCSYPRFLELVLMTGHTGELYGIEPNTEQFNGLPYLQLLDSDPELTALKEKGDPEQLANFYKQCYGNGKELRGVTLYEAKADFIPLPDDSIDVATTIFSAYHALRNPAALHEIKRILSKTGARAGIHADANSGKENKQEMIQQETEISESLSRRIGQLILPPPPLQAGFTSENMLVTFPSFYKHVYVKFIEQEIIMTSAKEIILNSHRSYRNSYTAESGALPEKFRDRNPMYGDRPVIDEEVFDEALDEVVGSDIDRARFHGQQLTAKVRRTISLSSDDEIDLPSSYEKVA